MLPTTGPNARLVAALRANGHANVETLRVGYKRNTTDVEEAVAQILAYHDRADASASADRAKGSPATRVLKHPVKAVVMAFTSGP